MGYLPYWLLSVSYLPWLIRYVASCSYDPLAHVSRQAKRAVPSDSVNVQVQDFALSGNVLSGHIYVGVHCLVSHLQLLDSTHVCIGKKHRLHQSCDSVLFDEHRHMAFQCRIAVHLGVVQLIHLWYEL